ncbi:FadR/GntR family transcriptional regulator [Aureimonas leprariae]|uniref:FadR family transcriptional regulator n=1 Tax=Plantimonas leprariae TaxID=2615207 RepID=A0A7V7PNX2_9HYPH|nr:FCD domain-containing protein [Aureimonas leprariae]KAB0679534.1 FadR family transcriptional regulator [Aureimonas leprariae]
MLPSGATRETVQTIGRAIVGGTYPAGSRLPFEDELAAELGVGRNSLREAVKVLAGKGLVRTARRYGTFVTDAAMWNAFDPDVLAWRLADSASHARFKREVADLRAMIEPGAAALAAEAATPEERARILKLAEAIDAADPAAAIGADVDLHLAILAATHNSLLQGFSRSLDVLLRTLFDADLRLMAEGQRYDPNPAVHLALASAVAGGRAEEARFIAMAITARGRQTADALDADPALWIGRAADGPVRSTADITSPTETDHA